MKLNDYSEDISYLKKEIKKYGQSNELIVWLRERLNDMNPGWSQMSDDEAEFYLLSRIEEMLSKVQKDKPSNVREYVEKQLKKKEYDKKLASLENSTRNLHVEDKNRCQELKKKVEDLIDEAEAEFPGFIEGRRRQISNILGDILAVETDGKAGSFRMVQRINLIRIAKKELEEKKT